MMEESDSIDGDQGHEGEAGTEWFSHPRYQRYWAHYHRAYAWYRQHLETVRENRAHYQRQISLYNDFLTHSFRAAEVCWQMYSENGSTGIGFPRPFMAGRGQGAHSSQSHDAAVGRGRGMQFGRFRGRGSPSHMCFPHHQARGSPPKRQRMNSGTGHHEQTLDGDSLDEDSHDENIEMEVTEHMVEFLAQSARYRQERDAERKKEKERDKEINTATGQDASTSAPKEQPGKRRTAEMRWLYGKGAAMIHGMETAMQLNYDRNCDKKNPQYWPYIPLNIKFS